MKTKKLSAQKAMGLPAGIGLGVLASLLIVLLSAAGITQLVAAEKMEEDAMGNLSIGLLFLASVFGAWLAAGRTKRMRLQVCLLVGAGFFMSLLAITALFFGGQYRGMGISVTAILLGSALVAFLPGLGQRKIKGKNRAYR